MGWADGSWPNRPGDHDGGHQKIVEMLAEGRVVELRRRINTTDREEDLFAAIAVVDASARLLEAGLADIQRLQRRAAREAPEDDLYRWWLDVILAERVFVTCDVEAIAHAMRTLTEIPTGAFLPVEVLFVRARLRRLASMSYLLDPSPESFAGHRDLRDGAVADFLRCGFNDEAAMTRGLSAGLLALITSNNIRENLHCIAEARAALGTTKGSIWGPALDFLSAAVSLLAGDIAGAIAGLDRLTDPSNTADYYDAWVRLCRAIIQFLATQGDAATLAQVDTAIDGLRDTHARLAQAFQMHLAAGLADLGRPEATLYAIAALDMPPLSKVDAIERQVLQIRIDALAGTVPSAPDLKALLLSLDHLGHVRQAGALALRVSHDCARLGSMSDADALHTWGLERLPGPQDRTLWEHGWARPLAEADIGAAPRLPEMAEMSAASVVTAVSSDQPSSPSPPVVVHVLAPVLTVEVGFEKVAVRETVAKLLLLLVAKHPSPVHIEVAGEMLWPGAPLETVRRRLNTTMHCLRRTLGANADAVRRSGDTIKLGSAPLEVDLFRYRADLRDPRRRPSAVAGIAGVLCHVQFPYDRTLLDARNCLIGEWMDHASTMLESGHLRLADLDAPLSAMGLQRQDLGLA